MTDRYLSEIIPNDRKGFQEEIGAWKKMLHSRIEDNIMMKNMLGNLLKNSYGINYLEEIEEFQNKFIREDDITDILRNDVTKFDDLSYSQVFKEERMRESCNKRLNKLRDDIIQSENYYRSLIASFDDFVFKIRR